MKILVSILAFALTILATMPSIAEEAHKGGHENLPQKMNALFPQPQPQPSKRELPAIPVLVNPVFNAQVSEGKVELKWEPVANATEYHLQVATDTEFKWIVLENYHLKSTNYEITALTPGARYYWRVAAVNTKNWNTFKKGFFAKSSFQAAPAPAVQ